MRVGKLKIKKGKKILKKIKMPKQQRILPNLKSKVTNIMGVMSP